MKKLLVTLTMLAVLLAMLTPIVSAYSYTVKLTANSSEVKQGGTVEITVSLKDIDVGSMGICGLQAVLEYDENKFETIPSSKIVHEDGSIESVDDDTFAPLNNWIAPDYNQQDHSLTLEKGSFVKTPEDILKITLKVKENAAIGNTSVTLKEIAVSNSEEDISTVDTTYLLKIVAKDTTPDPGGDDDNPGSGGDDDNPQPTQKPKVSAVYETLSNGVRVTLISDKELKPLDGWTLSANKKELTRVYENEYSGTVIVEDTDGNKSDPIAINTKEANGGTPSTPDNTAPKASVKYAKGTTGVTVTVTANEEIKPLEGWTLSADKKTLTRLFTSVYVGTIVIEDLAGNKSEPIAIDTKKADDGTPSTPGNNTPGNNTSGNNTSGNNTPGKIPAAGLDNYVVPIILILAVTGLGAYIRYKSME